MDNLKLGLYEQILTRKISHLLSNMDQRLDVEKAILDPGESHLLLAQHLGKFFAQKMAEEIKGKDKVQRQIHFCNRVLEFAESLVSNDPVSDEGVLEEGARLLGIHDPAFVKHAKPDTPLSVGSLLTATNGDPSLVSQLKQEIVTSDQVDILVSFIKWSGIRIIKDELEELTRTRRLRIITTSYLGATDFKAVDYLLSLPNTEVMVSFDTKRTRLHAKAYIFHRVTDYGTAYIGSSNISNPAMTDGLEWNVKICQYDSPHLWEKTTATFETYQQSKDFEVLSPGNLKRLGRALKNERISANSNPDLATVFFDIRPYPYQQEILDQLEAERTFQQRMKNLVVAATGTGKTVIAAFDYKRVLKDKGHCRFLFVAHREEILRQSLATFRNILRDQNFGELWVGASTPDHYEQLFVSVQTFRSQRLWERLKPGFYDYIVIDEFHHAAAESYGNLTAYFQPEIMLGLTATPERADGQDILKYFDYHISSEIRLPDAINRKLLSPFQYFCVTDTVDYSDLAWSRGGYDKGQLNNLLTGDDARARLVIEKMKALLLDVDDARGLCFCVSQDHAEFMARKFNDHGVRADVLTSRSMKDHRRTVIKKLVSRQINFICVVDLFNEGVDIPEIDTVLFLRPTESLTVFLQQLGRGLRLCQDKACLTVLDFIGRSHRKYNFEIRFKALLGLSSKRLDQEVEHSFPSLPAGCVIEMEKMARKYVLENIRHSLTLGNINILVQRIREFARESDYPLKFERFLDYYHLTPEDIYRKKSWSRLCAMAGVRDDFQERDEQVLTKGLRRFCHQNSAPQLKRLAGLLQGRIDQDFVDQCGRKTELLLTMFCFSIWNGKPPGADIVENISALKQNPTLFGETLDLIHYLYKKADVVVLEPYFPYPSSLLIHACYTRDEILAGLGYWTFQETPPMREGVKFIPNLKTDVFFITLNKVEKDYSPTTMYKDYAMGESLFHWQSQSTTGETTPTGTRYINHRAKGSLVLLFVREEKSKNNLACPYYFLGPADYVSHRGSRPMSIRWQLRHPMPGKLVRTTARMAAA